MRLRVLDLCCGTMGFSAGFIRRGDIVTGVDIADLLVHAASVVGDAKMQRKEIKIVRR